MGLPGNGQPLYQLFCFSSRYPVSIGIWMFCCLYQMQLFFQRVLQRLGEI